MKTFFHSLQEFYYGLTMSLNIFCEGLWNFPTGGLALPTRGLKYGFSGTMNAQNLRKIAFYLPTGAIAP